VKCAEIARDGDRRLVGQRAQDDPRRQEKAV
jgi:hypothetical protein